MDKFIDFAIDIEKRIDLAIKGVRQKFKAFGQHNKCIDFAKDMEKNI